MICHKKRDLQTYSERDWRLLDSYEWRVSQIRSHPKPSARKYC